MRHPYRHIEDPTMRLITVIILAPFVLGGLLVLLGMLALGF